MIGIFVELLLSWVLLHFFAKRNLSVLGFRPTRAQLYPALQGLVLSMAFLTACFLTEAAFTHNPYRVSGLYTAGNLLNDCWYFFKSTAYEELIFRGALLYILIQRIGPRAALLVSSFAFGIYHWFSYGVIGNPGLMILIFLVTGTVGYAYARAFQKTGSMLLPSILHFGYNFTSMVIFSQKTGWHHWLMKTYATDPVTPGIALSLLFFLRSFGYSFLVLWWLRYAGRKPSPAKKC